MGRKLTKAEREVMGISKEVADKITVDADGLCWRKESPILLGWPRWTPGEAWRRLGEKTPNTFDSGCKRRMYQLIDMVQDYVCDGYQRRWCGSWRMSQKLRCIAKQIEFLVECEEKNLDPLTERRRMNRENSEKRFLKPTGPGQQDLIDKGFIYPPSENQKGGA